MRLGKLPPPPSQKSVSAEPLSVAYDLRGEGVGKPIIFVAASPKDWHAQETFPMTSG